MAQRLTAYARLERAVRQLVQSAKLDRAIAQCEAELATQTPTDYRAALQRTCLHQIEDATRWLDRQKEESFRRHAV